MDQHFEILRAIVAEETGATQCDATPQTAMADLPGWDSVNMTCVILAVEKHFGFTFTPDEMDRLATFNDFITVIHANATAG